VYARALFQLTGKEHPADSEIEAMELLGVLIERYESERYPTESALPQGVVRFLLERNHLQQRDLVPEFGSEAAISMFLSGKRPLTVQQIAASVSASA
jgi:HTH-type transcriptional regulator/antitoxin HigA